MSKADLNIWYRKLCLELQSLYVHCSSWPGLHTLQQGFWSFQTEGDWPLSWTSSIFKLLFPSHQAACLLSCCPSQPCAGLQFYLMSLHRSLVLTIVERLESVWLSVWTGVFYTGNRFKHIQLILVMRGEQEGFLKRN